MAVFNDFVSLFFPNLCLACGHHLSLQQKIICVSCQYHLPQTDFHTKQENAFSRHFWGRIPLKSAAALYYFSKGGRTQQLIHQLKYKKKWEVGLNLGKYYGLQLKEAPLFRDIDMIVPVPLHPRKQQIRTYNQSDLFAKGLSLSLNIPWQANALKRLSMSESQTKKSRMERLANVQQAFVLHNSDRLSGKHILLVDDVVTTGATLEACALQLLQLSGTSVSLATLAFACD